MCLLVGAVSWMCDGSHRHLVKCGFQNFFYLNGRRLIKISICVIVICVIVISVIEFIKA